jgi:hypothetical protein
MPKISRIKRAALKVEHAVILWNEVQVTSATRNPRKLGDHAVWVRDRMNHVAANGEVETTISGLEPENALALK